MLGQEETRIEEVGLFILCTLGVVEREGNKNET
jgi:hypothetical protein